MGTTKVLGNLFQNHTTLTTDSAKLVAVVGAAFFIIFWAASVFHVFGATFTATDSAAYGAGLSTVLLGMAGALKLKESSDKAGNTTMEVTNNGVAS